MTTLITITELEQLTERELCNLYANILDELLREGRTPDECPLAWLTLANIRLVLARRRSYVPRP